MKFKYNNYNPKDEEINLQQEIENYDFDMLLSNNEINSYSTIKIELDILNNSLYSYKTNKNINLLNNTLDLINGQSILSKIKMLEGLSMERKSVFLKNLISQYPLMTLSELELYLSNQKKEKSLISLAGGVLIDSIFNLIKNKGVSYSQIQNKLNSISDLNEKMYKIVEDPIFEDIYLKTM